MCDDCGRYAKELEGLGELARDALLAPLDVGRLAELERRILERVRSEIPPSTDAERS
jgi:hypothetical protein